MSINTSNNNNGTTLKRGSTGMGHVALTTTDRAWGLVKKLITLVAIGTLVLNVRTSRRLREKYAEDYAVDLAEFARPIEVGEEAGGGLGRSLMGGISSLSSPASASSASFGASGGGGSIPPGGEGTIVLQGGDMAGGAGETLTSDSGVGGVGGKLTSARTRPPNKVLKILQVLEKQERTMRPPEGLRRVVVLGKSFIVKRDFSIWEMTFGDLNFEVTATNKQELAHEGNDGWSVMLCLDLFDGKSHCIEPADLPSIKRWQKISRLVGLRKILWNKDRFCETMGSALKGFTNYTEFVFPCWILPGQFNDMIQDVRERYQNSQFILKPTDRGEGNGIIVMDSYKKLPNWKAEFPDNDEIVVQTYLNDPMLIRDRKWDMRTYVLITSIHPLRLYMYRDGLVRFATTKYDKDAKDGGKKTAYLTNTSVNKKTGQSVEDLTWPYPQVYDYLRKHDHVDPDVLWKRIERAVTQVIMSSESAFLKRFKTIRNDYTCSNCYQLLGVDVIVDANVVPRIIEVNGEPSMQLSGEVNSHYDHTKKSMTHDLVKILFSTESYARELTALLYELELDGWSIGFLSLGGCVASDDICLRSIDLQYLLDFVKEDYNMGGFRRLYPCEDGDYFTRFLQHLESKLPYGTLTSTYRLHKVVTTLAQRSKIKHNNAIHDPSYLTRTGGLSSVALGEVREAPEDVD